jgi:hypothetical protein
MFTPEAYQQNKSYKYITYHEDYYPERVDSVLSALGGNLSYMFNHKVVSMTITGGKHPKIIVLLKRMSFIERLFKT